MGFNELVDQASGGSETDPIPLAASGEAQGDRQMGLASAGGAQKYYVLLGLDVVALSQLQNRLAVQGRDSRELKFIEGLENWEACLDDALAFRVGLLMVNFSLQQRREIAFVGLVALSGFLGKAPVVGRDSGQPQPLQVRLQEKV